MTCTTDQTKSCTRSEFSTQHSQQQRRRACRTSHWCWSSAHSGCVTLGGPPRGASASRALKSPGTPAWTSPARRPSSGFDGVNEEANVRANATVVDGHANVHASAVMTHVNDDDANDGIFDDTLCMKSSVLHSWSLFLSTLISHLAPSTSTSTSLALHFSLHSPPSPLPSPLLLLLLLLKSPSRSRSFHYHNHLFPLLMVVL